MTEPKPAALRPNQRRRLWLAAAATAGLGVAGYQAWQAGQSMAKAQDWLFELSFPQANGEALALKTLKSQPLLINFWATWCPPCVEEMPLLEAFYRQNRAKMTVLGLAVDREAAVVRHLQDHPINYPIAITGAAGTALTQRLGHAGGGLPYSVLLDRQGRPVARWLGKLNEQQLQQWLNLV